MSRVAIVTDSTCDLNDETLTRLDVVRVPLKVLFGEDSFLDWIDLTPADFYAKLTTSAILPKTSQPSPAEFLTVYEALAVEGYSSIISIHLSSELSGTYESAHMASADSPIPVTVLDSRTVSHALGLVVRAASEARSAGHDHDAIVSRVQKVIDEMTIMFVLDTLEFLVKGGRAGKAAGLAASVLNIKPVLEIRDEGIIVPFKKVKGRKRALAEVGAEVARESKERGRMKCEILHAGLADNGAELVADVQAAGADVVFEDAGLIGAVIGTYAGPNAIGIAFYPIDAVPE